MTFVPIEIRIVIMFYLDTSGTRLEMIRIQGVRAE
jgi:hypothetical protein